MGKHCSTTSRPPTGPDTVPAFTIGTGTNQLRAFWVPSDSPTLHIEGGTVPADQIPALISLLTASKTFAPYLAVSAA